MFSGKVVLVTGSSQGIGAATAVQFAKLGAKVIITGRNAENLKRVAKNCEEVSKEKPLVVVGDMAEEKFAQTLLEATIKEFKKLDVLVNNAAVGGTGGIQDVSLSMEQYDKLFNVNIKSVYRLTKLAIPYLIETKGNIINISSTAGLRPFPKSLDYSMTKAALEQFTRCLALELASKQVRVNVVSPGPVYTNFRQGYGFTDEQTEKLYEFLIANNPMKRIAQPEEIAAAIVFLAGEGASYITGASLPVDAGFQLV